MGMGMATESAGRALRREEGWEVEEPLRGRALAPDVWRQCIANEMKRNEGKLMSIIKSHHTAARHGQRGYSRHPHAIGYCRRMEAIRYEFRSTKACCKSHVTCGLRKKSSRQPGS